MSASPTGTPNKYVPSPFSASCWDWLGSLGRSWRMATFLWSVPPGIGAGVMLTATSSLGRAHCALRGELDLGSQPFAPSYWAFTFGLSALAISFLRFVERGATGPSPLAAPYVFSAVNLAIGGIAAGTLWLLLPDRLLPPPLQPPPESLHPAPRLI